MVKESTATEIKPNSTQCSKKNGWEDIHPLCLPDKLRKATKAETEILPNRDVLLAKSKGA